MQTIKPSLNLYNPEEMSGKSWYEITVRDQAEEKISESGLLETSLDTLRDYFFPSLSYTEEQAEYCFAPKYEEYRQKVTKGELDRDLDILMGRTTEKLAKGAGCLFYHIDDGGKLWVLLEKRLNDVHNTFGRKREDLILYDLGGKFQNNVDSCAFTCAKREVEEESNGILTMDGLEELCEDSIKTPYFLYFREIDKISTLNFGNKENKTGISRNISWYHLIPSVQNSISQRVPRSLLFHLIKRGSIIQKEQQENLERLKKLNL